MTLATAGPRFTPAQLAHELHLHPPTPEQVDIISAAPHEPLLVVAGAGSGKTETMAARVVWLVANGHIRPEQILGLTFTRKAAGELAHRVRARLAQLVNRLGRDDLLDGEPTVSTYHAYAGRIVAEHGVRAGYEPTTRLLTEATCWQLADAVVRRYEGDMGTVTVGVDSVTSAVLQLAAELGEHLVDDAALAAWTGRFHAEVERLPGRMLKAVEEVLGRQRGRLALLPLVREYTRRKRDLEAMDFADQLERAARVARDHPEVGAVERDRFRAVLLDEYQDTSVAQVVLLQSLFGRGHPVTAVGDPCQSIYGWRGASAGTLERFPADFRRRDGRPARALSLATSWRNRPEILQVANALSAPLRARDATVVQLAPAPRFDARAGAHTVHCALLRTSEAEAAWIADRIATAWRHDAAQRGAEAEPPPTTAVLVRVRAQIPAIEAALRAQDLPVDVVGLGGLLDTPEVRDLVSALRALADPTDGAALLRLLTGPRWRIGARDLVALYARSRALAAQRRQDGAPPQEHRLDQATLSEALDHLGEVEQYSAEGLRRFTTLGAELRALRARLDQPLPELVTDIERVLSLDVEVACQPGEAGLARTHLDAFGEVAARFHTEAEGAGLGGFLAYLEAAESEERGLAPGEVEVREGAVQLLTVHAAKGLEWDIVAVAGLNREQFPGRVSAADHYLKGLGCLPFPLRGDRAGLPELSLSGATDQKGVAAAVEAFTAGWRSHDEREERRLAYVAVTRPRRLLLCSGAWWQPERKRPSGPSPFLAEIRDSCLDGVGEVDEWCPDPADGDPNPLSETVAQSSWPVDFLGRRRPAVEAAAARVRAAMAAQAQPSAGPDAAAPLGDLDAAGPHGDLGAGRPHCDLTAGVGGDPGVGASAGDGDEVARQWAEDVELLLAERAAFAPDPEAAVAVALPAHLSVSQLVALRRDPQELARTLRRPLPTRPDPHTRRGTAFHAWLERRYGADRLLDLEELPGAADDDAAPDTVLAELKERFLASAWADRTPVEVEVGFATTVAGVVVRGRMDAVFADPDGGYDVVDWKTGRRPGGRDADSAAVQLAAYRLAWAQLAGCPVGQVRAAFHYVRDGVTVRPADLLDEAGLTALVARLPTG